MTTKKDNKEIIDDDMINDIVSVLEGKVEEMIKAYVGNEKTVSSTLKEKIAEPLHEAVEATEKTVAENPFKTIGATFLGGLILGLLLKS